MEGEPQLLYLEPDDEITSVIRRLRGADAGRVVLVAPGRSRATSSVVALRLLSRAASEAGRSVALVADASTRALAGEAGIAAFASVAEATSPTPVPAEPMIPARAPIHVVRGAATVRDRAAAVLRPTNGLDETMAVHLPPPVAASRASGRGRRASLVPRWPWLTALLVVALGVVAALLPGATVRITPTTVAVAPRPYTIRVAIASHQSDELRVTRPGTATGTRLEQVQATGTVTFFNRSIGSIEVPQGTSVSVGGTIAFTTTEAIVVPGGVFFGEPGQKSVGVVAVVGGTSGNVAAGAIDTIDDASIRFNRRVTNAEATSGGTEIPHPVIQQVDVDTVLAAIQADLQQQLADALAGQPDRLYAGPAPSEVPSVEVRPDLVGMEDAPTFELTGVLAFDRPYVARADVEEAARAALLDDPNAAPAGTTVLRDSITVELGGATVAGDGLEVAASVSAAAAATIDEAALRDRVAGLTVDEARAELADLGQIDVDLWPPWLDRLPRLAFRIGVETVAESPGESPSESVGG